MFEKLLIPPKKIRSGKGFFNLTNEAVLKFYQDNSINNPEGYKIEITKSGIEIYSSTEAGSFYAIQTLKEMATVYDNVLPCCVIGDEPDFARRGVYLDCSRGKVPKLNTIKQLIEKLAAFKINEFQLYIENVFTFKKHPEIGKGYSPFTPKEILDIQQHCKNNHIRFVGSLASFGHFEKILSLPRYQSLGELAGFRGYPGGTTLCPTDPKAIKLVKDLYSEFLPLFEAEDFNVCCDETWELGQGRSKTLAEKIGKGEVYLQFLLQIYELCQKHGKRMNAWADIVLKHPELLKKLPKDIVMLNWWYEAKGEYIDKTKEIAKAGLPFMVCPGTSSWLTHGSRLTNSMLNVINFANQGRKYGAEGLLNTDWGDNGHRNFLGISLHSFAHSAAHSWNGKAVDNNKFTDNFCLHFFGQKDTKLSKMIKQLGNNYITCGKAIFNASFLFYGLFEDKASLEKRGTINVKDLKRVIEQSPDFENISLPKETDSFTKIAIDEMRVAQKMDLLAAKRILALRNSNISELKKLNKPFEKMTEEFKDLWLIRNKPSRLKDNLKLFKKTLV